jgi:outer membrane protein assembly factor BamA
MQPRPVGASLVLVALVSCLLSAEPAPKTISSVEIVGGEAAIPLETRPGQTVDQARLSKDIKTLYRSGRFADVRVETVEDGEAVRVLFRVEPNRPMKLRKIDVIPPTPGIDIQLKPESEINNMGAQQIGANVRKKLEQYGYPFAKVQAKLVAVNTSHADLEVLIDRGRHIDIRKVNVTGDLGAPGESANKALKWSNSKTILPAIPGVWNGWHLWPGYSDNAVDYDVANLKSFYYARGYFDADVKADPPDLATEKATLNFDVRAGEPYAIREINLFGADGARQIQPARDGGFPARDVCKALLQERRKAERTGVMDFSAKIEVRELPDTAVPGGSDTRKWADLTATIQKGQAYKVGRIEFYGMHSFSDSTVRRSFVFDEGDPLDQTLLRKSIARLNNTGLFEPLTESNVVVRTPPGSDHADIMVDLHEKKMRHWLLSGPVGPMSVAGPLEFAIGSRLPPWGRHLIELSTYAVSMHFMLFPKPLAQLLPGFPNSRFIAMATIDRPLLPGETLLSGFSIAPQLGWRGIAGGYVLSKARGFTSALFARDRYEQPVLPVAVVHTAEGGVEDGRGGVLYCELPKPRLDWARRVGGTATSLMFSFVPF